MESFIYLIILVIRTAPRLPLVATTQELTLRTDPNRNPFFYNLVQKETIISPPSLVHVTSLGIN